VRDKCTNEQQSIKKKFQFSIYAWISDNLAVKKLIYSIRHATEHLRSKQTYKDRSILTVMAKFLHHFHFHYSLYHFILIWIVYVANGQFSFERMEGMNTFCDVGPDALTQRLHTMTNGTPVPQFCIPNPVSQNRAPRCYYLFVPPCASGRVPLVMNSHGSDTCPLWAISYDRWVETALRHCFVLVYPLGVTELAVADYPCMTFSGGRDVNGIFSTQTCCCYKNGRSLKPTETLDVEVLQKIVQDIIWEKRVDKLSNNTTQVDEKRIYMAGHSNGCIAALTMAAYHSDFVAAVGCHAAGSFVNLPTYYEPVPTWLTQGKKDDIIWYQFAKETAVTLAWVHNCQNETTLDLNNDTGVIYSYYNCTKNATVRILLLNDSGHMPFKNSFEVSEGASRTQVDTTEMAWKFCSQFSKEDIPKSLISTARRPFGNFFYQGYIILIVWMVFI
jgi:poly(3-hydroxybutyrate) depolymerase